MLHLSKADLAEAVSDVLVQRGTLRRVHITHDEHSLTLVVDATLTISELKILLRERWNIPEKEQVLKNAQDETLFYGPLFASVVVEASFSLETRKWDPRQEAMLKLIGLTAWQERDEIMAKMALGRKGQRCYYGHELVESEPPTPPHRPTQCSSCHQTCGTTNLPTLLTGLNRQRIRSRPKRRVCAAGGSEWCCGSFVLCESCYEHDTTSCYTTLAFRKDPFVALAEMAKDVGRNILLRAKSGVYFGIPLEIPHDFEFAPRRLLSPWRFYDPVLPKGTRFVLELGLEEKDLCGTEIAQQLHVEKMLENGMTLGDIDALLMEKLEHIWEAGFRQHEAWFELTSYGYERASLSIRMAPINIPNPRVMH